MNPAALEPHRHEAPPGWPVEVFEQVTNAIAAALVAAVRRQDRKTDDGEERPA